MSEMVVGIFCDVMCGYYQTEEAMTPNQPELGTCPTCGSLRRYVRGTCVYTAIPGVRPPLPSLCGDSWHSEPLAPAKPESQTYPEMLAEIVKLSGRLDVTEFKAIVARREQEVARATKQRCCELIDCQIIYDCEGCKFQIPTVQHNSKVWHTNNSDEPYNPCFAEGLQAVKEAIIEAFAKEGM